jgi:hypothetical protein
MMDTASFALPSPKGAIPLRTNFWPGWQAKFMVSSVRLDAIVDGKLS